MDSLGMHRPRNVDWKRAAALLYGDWGTSKAYVIGLAFVAAAYASLPIIVAVCVLTAVVGYNYTIVCRYFPDGGGVYSAARNQSRLLAVIGALLLVANFTVTAAMSGSAAMHYFGVSNDYIGISTVLLILGVGVLNYFGPKHSGSFAVLLAVPMILAIVLIIGWSIPYLTTHNLTPSKAGFTENWVFFVGVILALSGVEAVANLTGVMKLDPGSTMENPRVGKTAAKAIFPVALEVVGGTILLGWAMLSLPTELSGEMKARWEDMLRFLGEQYGAMAYGPKFGEVFGLFVGIVVGLLLLSAVNTSVAALIGLFYMLARDGEMPKPFVKLNSQGVPWLPLAISVGLPIIVIGFTSDLVTLADLYAIGVVGAIAVNLGSCTLNAKLPLKFHERTTMAVTFLVLLVVELTIAKTKHDALFFVSCILILGLGLRGYAQRRAGLHTVTVSREVAAAVAPESVPDMQVNLSSGQSILVAARGMTPVLQFALQEAHLRKGTLYVLYVKEIAVSLPATLAGMEKPKWQDDPVAAKIMYPMIELGRRHEVPVVPIYLISENPATSILDLAATLGIDILMLGSSHRRSMVSLLKGNVVTEVAKSLPENIQLVIYG